MSTLTSQGIALDSSTSQGLSSHPRKDQILPKAKEFEAILLGQWLQAAQTSFANVPGGDEDSDPGDDQFKSFAIQQLARKLTDAGGFGIAAIVAKALEKVGHSGNVNDVPASSPERGAAA